MPFARPGQTMPDHIGRKKRRLETSFGYAPSGWSPLDNLGASLFDLWDAEDASKITRIGAEVSAWSSGKNGYSAVQANSPSRPNYSSTSFNGRPGVTFDGVDDELTYSGVGAFPIGAVACEMWALVDQIAVPALPTSRRIIAYGGSSTSGSRQLQRVVVADINRGRISVGDGALAQSADNIAVDLSGRVVLRARVGATTSQLDVQGVAGDPLAVVPGTLGGVTRLGASTAGTPGGFFQGVMSLVAITAPLSASQATSMLAYLKTRAS